MPKQLSLYDELIIDNFAGGGGASTGIERTTGRPVDIAINHDPAAIAMHKVNHPHTIHHCESVWDIDPRETVKGKPVALAWFSPDCKHFSKAKGGKPVNKDMRGLAWVAVRWAATVKPRVIILLLTADAANRYGLAMAFMSKYYSGGHNGSGNAATEPINTITGIDHNALVTSYMTIFRNGYSRGGQKQDEPLNTITASPGHFGEVRALLVKYYGQGDGQTVTDPLHTVCGKDIFGVVTVHGEEYIISDIGLRMLTPRELFNAQGFPPDYAIDTGPDGKPISKTAQVARCGNAVPPPFAEALVRANLPELCGIGLHSMAELRKEMAV
jgi:site-specific DNA-cytosine methylase